MLPLRFITFSPFGLKTLWGEERRSSFSLSLSLFRLRFFTYLTYVKKGLPLVYKYCCSVLRCNFSFTKAQFRDSRRCLVFNLNGQKSVILSFSFHDNIQISMTTKSSIIIHASGQLATRLITWSKSPNVFCREPMG